MFNSRADTDVRGGRTWRSGAFAQRYRQEVCERSGRKRCSVEIQPAASSERSIRLIWRVETPTSAASRGSDGQHSEEFPIKSTSDRSSSFSAGLSPVAALANRIRSGRATGRVDVAMESSVLCMGRHFLCWHGENEASELQLPCLFSLMVRGFYALASQHVNRSRSAIRSRNQPSGTSQTLSEPLRKPQWIGQMTYPGPYAFWVPDHNCGILATR